MYDTKQKTTANGLITLWSVNCYRIAARRPTMMLHIIIICPTFFFFTVRKLLSRDEIVMMIINGISSNLLRRRHLYRRTQTYYTYYIILYKPHNMYYRRLKSQFPRLFFFSCNAGHNKNKENRGSTIIHDVRACAPTTFCTETAAVFNKISNNHNGRTAAGQI